ncbi:hypothetical protein Lacidipiscis_00590 [Ligilactobacillus acidipiscis]|nr:hypothetical protein Lacidipiscis_00590 [Ligilactobacillus acidipiscis]
MQEWQLQAAAETFGYEGIWDVPEDEMEEVMSLAEAMGD